MGPSSRRLVAGLIRVGLVVVVIVLVSGWIMRRTGRMFRHSAGKHVSVQTEAPPADSLGPGDLRIFNTDSSVDVVLQGDRILAGLSPKTIAKVKRDMEKDSDSGNSALGATIASAVKKSVAGAIGMHAVYPLSKVREIRQEDGRIILEWKDGGSDEIFSSAKVDGERVSRTFRSEDAERFVQAVRARMSELHQD